MNEKEVLKMNEKELFKNINEFENELKNQLNQKTIKQMECYLLESNWKNKLLKSFNLASHQEINQSFIDNFNMAIKFLKNDGQISYVSKKIIESNFNKEEINKCHNISQIYVANKKIIIDFQRKDSIQSILIINPFENKRKIFILVFKKNNKDKKEIFESLLSKNITNISDIEKIKEKNLDYLIKFDDYIKNINNNDENNINLSSSIVKNNEKEIKEILQILILLYYYERSLSKLNNIFNEKQVYYLINQKWIESYKDYYHYTDLIEIIKEYDFKNKDINFFEIEPYIKNIVNDCYNKYITYKIQLGLQENSKNKDLLKASISKNNNMDYYNNCYIIPSTIIDKIIQFEFNTINISLIPQRIFSKDENIFLLLDSNNIINVGNIDTDKTFLYKNKYIFLYNSEILYKTEKKELFKQSLEAYIKQKSCDEKSFEIIQYMKNKKGENIGKLIILSQFAHSSRNLKKNNKYNGSKTYKKVTPIKTKQEKINSKNNSNDKNIMKENQNNKLINNTEEKSFLRYTGNIDNESEYSQTINLQRNKIVSPFNKKHINIIFSNAKKENELNLKINDLKMINEENKKIIELKEKNESELRNKISDLNKIIKENNDKYLQKEKELKEKILKLEKQIEENNIKNDKILRK